MKSVLLLVVVLAVLTGTGVQSQVILPILTVSGTVKCTQNYADTTAPPFPNAQVELLCRGAVVATATTNINGLFEIDLNVLRVSLGGIVITVDVLETCSLEVTTPLVNCNATLTTHGILVSTITRLINGVFVPVRFIFVAL